MSRGFQGTRKLTTGELLSLDINRLGIKRAVRFKGEVSWKNGNRMSAIKTKDDEITFNYTYTAKDTTKNYNYDVELDYTSCNYGNERPWFICPHCGKRVGKLYLRYGYFRCRTCQNLNYSIQQEDKWDRMIESIDQKIFKIQSKLKTKKDIENIYFIDKPKGMHWRTYSNLMKNLKSVNNFRYEIIDSIVIQRWGCNVAM